MGTSHRHRRQPTIEAKPAPIQIDLAHAAVLVIDMQNDFGSKGGMFDRAGIDISGIRQAVVPTVDVLNAARRAELHIIYIKMGFHPDLADLGGPDAPNRTRHLMFGVGESVAAPDGKSSRILVRDTWGTDIVDALRPAPGDTVIYKTRYSAFYRTELDDLLRELRVEHLIVTGCTTSVCVDATIRDAFYRDYQCVLVADCTAEPIGADTSRSNYDATLLTVELLFGWTTASTQLIDALERAS